MDQHLFDNVCTSLQITDDIKNKAWLCMKAYFENSKTTQVWN